MRGLVVAVLGLAACTPEIVSGSYLCGPNASCPEDQRCNGSDNICVTGSPEPFSCDPDKQTEPDDAPEQAYDIGELSCVSLAAVLDSCMLAGDSGDWVRIHTPASCGALTLDVRLTFPTAFEDLGLELWDVGTATRLTEDMSCPYDGEAGNELRCLTAAAQPGATYGVHVLPTGEGTCDGNCAYNRYTVRFQLSPAR